MQPEREQDPTYVTPPVIALIISGDEEAAEKYVRTLPRFSSINVVAEAAVVQRLRLIARAKRHALTRSRNVPAAICQAGMCMVFGRSPFNDDDIRVLDSQGIPVGFHGHRERR